jgi:hypothetical protein
MNRPDLSEWQIQKLNEAIQFVQGTLNYLTPEQIKARRLLEEGVKSIRTVLGDSVDVSTL